jgi:CRP-like cAMP-binding protein
MSRVYSGMDGLLLRMTYLMSGNAYTRLMTELLIQAKRFGKSNTQAVDLKISEKDLAIQSGLTRETVSREMKILKDKELVSFSGNMLTIHNIQQFEQELVGY